MESFLTIMVYIVFGGVILLTIFAKWKP